MLTLNMFDLVLGFAKVVDLVNATLANHHRRVAYIAGALGDLLNLDRLSRNRLVMAAMVHDVGVIPLHALTDSLVFEKDMERHSLAGWLLLDSCQVFRDEAKIIRYHHSSWQRILTLPEEERFPARLGNLVHLSDAIDVHVRTHFHPDNLVREISAGAGSIYSPEVAGAAVELVSRPGFLNNLSEASNSFWLPPGPELIIHEDRVALFALLFARVIDARSPFTATHSSGVAHSARFLYELAGLPDRNRPAIFVAGLLHDIGKMGVPLELLEKQGPLEPDEFRQVSRHALLSYEVLSDIPGFEKVAPWGAWHHERLNGRGYPQGLKADEIPLESRLMAVADVLTALSEDRPYRAGLSNDQVLSIMDRMVDEGALDGDVLALVHDHIEETFEVGRRARALAKRFFQRLGRDIAEATARAKTGLKAPEAVIVLENGKKS
ncbi:MAG: HD domain-containing protein [Candidatus Adiutrix sp.]|jgi:HD-GYP domain-containing protein (c-di-GMP phosphodiesterase class II)|nr:HD domain-containing protein [Candidatus Adiutrix sp.]